MTRLIFFSPLIILVFGCNQINTTDRIEDCKSKIILNLDSILPFDKHNIKVTSILIHLPKETVIDGESVKTVNVPLNYLTLRCDSSNIVFLSSVARGFDFKLIGFDLKSNMFLFKNKIKIGMHRLDFYRIMDINKCNLDTFELDATKNYNLIFFFSKDTLRRIMTHYLVEP